MVWSVGVFPWKLMDLSMYSIVPEAYGPHYGLHGLEHIDEKSLKSVNPALGTGIQYMGLTKDGISGTSFYKATEMGQSTWEKIWGLLWLS